METGDKVTAKGETYTLCQLIGKGGMGRVFEVRREKDNQSFALKCGVGSQGQSVDREAGVLTAFPDHPAIPHVVASGWHFGQPWFIMPFLRGASVRELLSDVGNLPLPWVMDIMGTVCSALQAVHTIGPHRDLKPDNVLVTREGRTYLLDFGIQQIGSQTTSLGTARYASPEQLSGDAVDWRTDLFATGLLLFEMLVGAHPFDLEGGADSEIIKYRIATEDPAKVHVFAPTLAKYVGGMCEVLLSKSPSSRSVSSMADVASWCCRVKNQWHAEHGEPEDLRDVFGLRQRVVRAKSLITAMGPDKDSSPLVVTGTHEEHQEALEDTLEDMLCDDTCPAVLRAEVIHTLVRRGDVGALSVLRKAQNDPDFQVRRLATLGVCRLSSFAGASQ